MASDPTDNLKRESFPKTFGIESRITNRALRFEELLSADTSISAEEFRAIKFDKLYSKRSELAKVIGELLSKDFSRDPDGVLLTKAQNLLRGYDMSTGAENRSTALAVMTGLPVVVPAFAGKPRGDAVESLRAAARTLMKHYGRLDPVWGEVNRFRRGQLNAPADGGPDVLRDFEAAVEVGPDGTFTAAKGDTLYYLVDWNANGQLNAKGIHQFGSATLDEASPHYADQSLLFLREELKPIWMDEAELRKHLEREYRPGKLGQTNQ